MDLLFKICIVLLVGFIGGKIAGIFKLPNVSGYLVAGLFLGPSFFKYISPSDIDTFSVISELALAMIAFSIGNEFILKDIKKLGKSIAIITLAEVVGAVTVVFCVIYFVFNQSFAFSIIIASMSAATAPVATLLVIRQYKADGPLTKAILPVVALDDVLGIIVFGIALSLAKISIGEQGYSIIQLIGGPMIEVFGAIILGTIIGVLLVVATKKIRNRDELQMLSLASIGIATGISNLLGVSSLLTCIMMGAIIVNTSNKAKRTFDSINDFAAPVFTLFFTLAGASLDLSILKTVGLMGIGYIIARAGGKMLGAWAGAKAVKAEPAVRKYLGLALLPQGGISIGLLVLVRQQLPEISAAISTIIMFGVLIYEVSGPIFAKIAIEKAGEINGAKKPQRKKKRNVIEVKPVAKISNNA